MKTVSTKLDNSLHSRFIEICNEDGKCQSEFLRNLIETVCEDCSEEDNRPTTPQDLEAKPISKARITRIIRDDGTEFIPELMNPTVEY